ncbi:MAG TPA: SDR family NAD(P)-dependent oxidoreductase [Novosphingobium sp.]|nr:SDR family NAD(P)-dependent oxidoreductase [Novosphingobium sp.]
MGILSGRVAIVTGAASGIGRSVAERYAREGAAVVAADISAAGLQNLIDSVGDGMRFAIVPCDVGEESQIDRVVQTALERFGQIDILANIAQGGMADHTYLEQTTSAGALQSFVTGPLQSLLFMQKCLPSMRERHYGRIINVSSHSALSGAPGYTPYEIAKGAIQALTRNASQEWGQHGITTNCVLPIIRTPAYDLSQQGRDVVAHLEQTIPVKRFGTPDQDCAPVFLFLASEEAGYVNGQMIGVDGGHQLIA